jgi:hypothetical protein
VRRRISRYVCFGFDDPDCATTGRVVAHDDCANQETRQFYGSDGKLAPP